MKTELQNSSVRLIYFPDSYIKLPTPTARVNFCSPSTTLILSFKKKNHHFSTQKSNENLKLLFQLKSRLLPKFYFSPIGFKTKFDTNIHNIGRDQLIYTHARGCTFGEIFFVHPPIKPVLRRK